MKMLKFKLVNPNNPEGDTVLAVKADEIDQIIEASPIDRRQRPEINSIIYTKHGPMAVREELKTIVERIEEATL